MPVFVGLWQVCVGDGTLMRYVQRMTGYVPVLALPHLRGVPGVLPLGFTRLRPRLVGPMFWHRARPCSWRSCGGDLVIGRCWERLACEIQSLFRRGTRLYAAENRMSLTDEC
jgi:hypothetical protein